MRFVGERSSPATASPLLSSGHTVRVSSGCNRTTYRCRSVRLPDLFSLEHHADDLLDRLCGEEVRGESNMCRLRALPELIANVNRLEERREP